MITDSNFEEKISNGHYLVMLWQDFCVHCKALADVLVEVAKEKHDLKFILLSSDINPLTKEKYKVDVCPTVLFFRDGNLQSRWEGEAPKAQVMAWVNKNV